MKLCTNTSPVSLTDLITRISALQAVRCQSPRYRIPIKGYRPATPLDATRVNRAILQRRFRSINKVVSVANNVYVYMGKTIRGSGPRQSCERREHRPLGVAATLEQSNATVAREPRSTRYVQSTWSGSSPQSIAHQACQK